MSNKVLRTVKMYPLISAVVGDLVLFVPIDTLYFVNTKGLDAMRVSLIYTFAMFICILAQRFVLRLVHRLGNCNSFRVGVSLLIIASGILLLSNSYIMFLLYGVIYEMAFLFTNMDRVILKSNLKYLDKESEYYSTRNKRQIMYAILTLLATLVSGAIFNFNNYLPLLLQVGIFVLVLHLSFVYVYEAPIQTEESVKQAVGVSRLKLSKVLILLLLFSAVAFSLIRNGQRNSKLFMQYDFQSIKTAAQVTYILTIIVFISRIARLLGNCVLCKVYVKIKDRIIILLAVLLSLAFGLLIIGHFTSVFVLRIILMGTGFCMILAIRDTFQVYAEDISLKLCSQEEQQQMVVTLEICRKAGGLIVGVVYTVMLLKVSMLVVEILFLVLALINIGVGIQFFKKLSTKV